MTENEKWLDQTQTEKNVVTDGHGMSCDGHPHNSDILLSWLYPKASTVVSQQEGSGFSSDLGLSVCSLYILPLSVRRMTGFLQVPPPTNQMPFKLGGD